jgi:glutamate synthase (NADPH/NADH) small chain
MSTHITPSHQRFTWCEVPREAPPKAMAVERVHHFREIYGLFDPQTVQEQASRCLQCPDPTCKSGCPLGNHINEWLSLTAEGKFLEAAAISQATSNMPEICSRVCPQERLCESHCILNGKTDPVCIGAIEEFINEYAFAHGGVNVARATPNGLSAAVIGAGPGGLACADELAKRGFAVTVFESQALPGGLLMGGIPAFKLEKSIVLRRVEVLKQRGVEFRMNVNVGRDVSLAELLAKFNAVFLGVGAQKSKVLDVPGAELAGVHQALPFLTQKNVDAPTSFPPIEVTGKRVVVLGGGDTAMDCLRTAVRCDAAEAVCLYRRDFENMPGSRKEYYNALEEGARFQFLTAPVAVEGENGRVKAVRCVRMELGEPDANGRRKPRAVKGSEFVVPADLVLVAYGFDPVPFPPESDFSKVAVNDWGAFVVDANQMTSVPGVFSGGDAVRGPSLVVHAVRDARIAAEGIARWLEPRLHQNTPPA